MFRSSSRLGVEKVLLNSSNISIGRLTPEFELSITEYFSGASLPIAKKILANDSLGVLPEKIRSPLIKTITHSLTELSMSEFLAILRFRSVLDNALFDLWIDELLNERRISQLDKTGIEAIISNILKIHLKHPCKDTPINRLFLALSVLERPAEKIELFLSVASRILAREHLAHPVVRSACVSLLSRLPADGALIHLSSRFPVFPDMNDLLLRIPPSKDGAVLAVTGFLQSRLNDQAVLSQWISKLNGSKDWNQILELLRSPVNIESASIFLKSINLKNITNIADLAKLGYNETEFINEVFSKLELPIDRAAVVAIYAAMPNCPDFDLHVTPIIPILRPREVRSLRAHWKPHHLALFTDAVCVAELPLDISLSLRGMLKTEKSLERVLLIQKALEANPSCPRDLLKEVTRLVWTRVRMAQMDIRK